MSAVDESMRVAAERCVEFCADSFAYPPAIEWRAELLASIDDLVEARLESGWLMDLWDDLLGEVLASDYGIGVDLKLTPFGSTVEQLIKRANWPRL